MIQGTNDIQEPGILVHLLLLTWFIEHYFVDFKRNSKSLHLKHDFERSSVFKGNCYAI